MKTKHLFLLIATFVFVVSCNTNSEYEIVTVAKPEYMTLDALRSSVKITSPIPIVESGKIYDGLFFDLPRRQRKRSCRSRVPAAIFLGLVQT